VTVSVDKVQSKTIQTRENAEVEFEAIFQAHWSRVYGAVFRIVGDRHEAEDLTLEVFWRLHQRPPEEQSNLVGWLYRVGTNLALNAIRARKRRERYELEAGKNVLKTSAAPNPLVVVERSQERAYVRYVLSKMRPRSAQILILRYSGLSYAEIATALRVSPKSVGTLLARAERQFERRYRALEGR
jgi:RNA polymerase sigma factor (sigma-70 family)